MIMLKNKFNGEEIKAEGPVPFYSVSYNEHTDTTEVYAFDSNTLLFTLSGKADDETIEDVMDASWEVKCVVKRYDIGIFPKENRGYFEHHIYGEDKGGELLFDTDGNLEDYDGVFTLPKAVIDGIRELGYTVDETFEENE